LAKLEQAYLDALAAVDAVEDRKVSAAKSGKFTSQGVVDDALAFAASTCAPKLRRARQVLEAAKQEAADRRAKLVLKTTDKTDAAGQMRRLWKLDRLAKMPDSERNTYIAKNIENLDPELAQAILEVPEFSGLLLSDVEQIRDCALRAQHGEEALAEQRDFETGIAIVEQVLPLAREAIAQDVGGEAALATAAEPFERAATAPVLIRQILDGQEVIRVVRPPKGGDKKPGETFQERLDRKYGSLAKPTAEELATGIVYDGLEAWRDAQQKTTNEV
jgi:hypothetical protein